MCGEIEEEDNVAVLLYDAYLHSARSLIHEMADHRGGSRARLGEQPGPVADDALHSYMDGLFCDVLSACIKDAQRADEGERYRVLSAQAVVIARLAGYLASNLDAGADPLRDAIGALMDGYDTSEPEEHHHHEHH